MGGSGGGFYRRIPPDSMKQEYAQVSQRTQSEVYESEVASEIRQLLAQYNDRDTDKLRDYLDEIEEILGEEIEGAIDLRFGGSISKHTYIDGLSDIDCLLLMRDPALERMSPGKILEFFKTILEERLSGIKEIRTGELAITVEYPDGAMIQLIPAVKRGEGFVISTGKGNQWSNIIRPEKFATALTIVNQRCGGKVVPTIKLVKATIYHNVPEEYRLTGYHIESMAIEALKQYSGVMTTKSMLEYFFEKAPNLVLNPIRDRTGQSIHVDDYLGPKNSGLRQEVASRLDLILRRMRTANASEIVPEWLAAIGE